MVKILKKTEYPFDNDKHTADKALYTMSCYVKPRFPKRAVLPSVSTVTDCDTESDGELIMWRNVAAYGTVRWQNRSFSNKYVPSLANTNTLIWNRTGRFHADLKRYPVPLKDQVIVFLRHLCMLERYQILKGRTLLKDIYYVRGM